MTDIFSKDAFRNVCMPCYNDAYNREEGLR